MTKVTLNVCSRCFLPIVSDEVETFTDMTYLESVIEAPIIEPFEETSISTSTVIPTGIYHRLCFRDLLLGE